MNYYGTDEYKKEIERLDKEAFCKCSLSEPTYSEELDSGYVLKVYSYEEITKEQGFAAVRVKGSICRLYQNDNLIFEWKCTETGSLLQNIIHHSNGGKYFLFSLDLYGYGVLDLNSGKCTRYIPQKSKASDNSAFEETFIWCEPHYDAESGLLAVDGCFWGDFYSVIVLDFTEPMKIKTSDEWLDLCELVPDKTDGLPVGDTEFKKWEKDSLIIETKLYDGKEQKSNLYAVNKSELINKCRG